MDRDELELEGWSINSQKRTPKPCGKHSQRFEAVIAAKGRLHIKPYELRMHVKQMREYFCQYSASDEISVRICCLEISA